MRERKNLWKWPSTALGTFFRELAWRSSSAGEIMELSTPKNTLCGMTKISHTAPLSSGCNGQPEEQQNGQRMNEGTHSTIRCKIIAINADRLSSLGPLVILRLDGASVLCAPPDRNHWICFTAFPETTLGDDQQFSSVYFSMPRQRPTTTTSPFTF